MGIDARQAAAGGMSVTIAVVAPDDLATVAEIEREVFSDPWSMRSFREAIEHPAVHFTCARSADGRVLGYVVAWFVADQGEIANLAVAQAGWGQGVGRALLDHALDEAVRRGVTAVYLEVRDSNDRARRLYRSSGFEEVGRRRRYYSKPVEDAIVLRRTLM